MIRFLLTRLLTGAACLAIGCLSLWLTGTGWLSLSFAVLDVAGLYFFVLSWIDAGQEVALTKRALECEVMKGSRHEDYIDVTADPDDPAELRDVLAGWLTANKWDEGLWHRFTLLVRYQGEGKVRRKVGAS